MRTCTKQARIYSIIAAVFSVACLVHAEDLEGKPALPSANTAEGVKLVLGQKLSLEGLGPAVVNEDGSLRRISNWDKLSTREKEVAFQRIKERNQERLAALKDPNKSQASASGEKQDPNAKRRESLSKYLEALDRLNKLNDGKDLQGELLKQAGLANEGESSGGIDYGKLQAALEMLKSKQEELKKKEEL